MKMTKELKEVLLKGFEEELIVMRGSEKIAQEYADAGNEEDRDYWLKRSRTYQDTILKAIEGLIEVEGE